MWFFIHRFSTYGLFAKNVAVHSGGTATVKGLRMGVQSLQKREESHAMSSKGRHARRVWHDACVEAHPEQVRLIVEGMTARSDSACAQQHCHHGHPVLGALVGKGPFNRSKWDPACLLLTFHRVMLQIKRAERYLGSIHGDAVDGEQRRKIKSAFMRRSLKISKSVRCVRCVCVCDKNMNKVVYNFLFFSLI